MKIASLDIDAQCCFTSLCPDELPVPEGDRIVPELNQQAAFATLRIGAKDAHSSKAPWIATTKKPQFTLIDAPHMDMHWNKHAVPGEFGFQLLPGLPHPADYDFFVWKGIEPGMHPYGACYHDLNEKQSTGLIEYLLIQKVDLIIAGGLALDYCVKKTVLQLRKAGFPVIVNLAATRGISSETIDIAMHEMKEHAVQFVKNAHDLSTLLNTHENHVA